MIKILTIPNLINNVFFPYTDMHMQLLTKFSQTGKSNHIIKTHLRTLNPPVKRKEHLIPGGKQILRGLLPYLIHDAYLNSVKTNNIYMVRIL